MASSVMASSVSGPLTSFADRTAIGIDRPAGVAALVVAGVVGPEGALLLVVQRPIGSTPEASFTWSLE